MKRLSAGIRGNVPSLFDLKTPAPKTPAPTKRPIDLSDSFDEDNEDTVIPQPKPKSRRTRTNQLRDRQLEEVNTLAKIGNFDYKLIKRWQCVDRTCKSYNGFCYIDSIGDRFNISHSHQSLWAKGIAHPCEEGVSIEQPPKLLYEIWRSAGAVGDNKKTAVAKSRDDARAEREESKSIY